MGQGWAALKVVDLRLGRARDKWQGMLATFERPRTPLEGKRWIAWLNVSLWTSLAKLAVWRPLSNGASSMMASV
jgi:hypothetical protein